MSSPASIFALISPTTQTMTFRRSQSMKSEGTASLTSLVTERYFTAGEFIPVSIPIEKIELGWTVFESCESDSPEDLVLLYEMNTNELAIQTSKPGSTGSGRPGVYKINGVQAASLELTNAIPGYLESILVRLVIETNQNVTYEPPIHDDAQRSSNSGTELKQIPACRIIVYASVHECGHLRDILLFMKSDTLSQLPIEEDNPYVSPSHGQENNLNQANNPPLTYLPTLPHWCIHIPWWMYSGRVRHLLQLSLLLYTVFTIIWASWQLYRHVNVIQLALEPIVHLLKYYLHDVMESIDSFLNWFTELSTTFLRPVYIFSGFFLVPLINTVMAFKSILSPFVAPVITFISQFSAPISASLSVVWRSIISARVAIHNIDLTQQVAKTLVMNTFRAILYGLLRLVGYKRAKDKEKKVIREKSKDSVNAAASPISRRYAQSPNSSIPVYYISSVTKKS